MISDLLPMILTLLGAWFLWSITGTAISLLPELVPTRIHRETRSTATVRHGQFGARRRRRRRAA